MRRFEARAAILEAAAQELTAVQLRRLKLAMWMRPVKTQAAIDTVMLNCQSMGMVTEDGEIAEAVDWKSILELIIELLPLILKLFGL